MRDKRMTAGEVVSRIRDGMTVGIGGWGSRRKPMALVKALLRSSVRDLTIVSYGGPDVGMLCAAGRARRVIYGFVSLDSIPLEPHFRAARQNGTIEAVELDEGMLQWGLYAASLRLPFLPTRAGLGSDVMSLNPWLRTIQSPYPGGPQSGSAGWGGGDGQEPPGEAAETLVAMKAIPLDVALVHMNRADAAGNAQFLGPDLYFDDLFLGAAEQRFVSCERIVPTADLLAEGSLHTLKVSRMMVDGVVEAPGGASFTSCEPDYGRDEALQREYAASAASPEAWASFYARWSAS